MKTTRFKAQHLLIVFLTIVLLALITFRTLDNTVSDHQILLKQLQQLEHNIHLLNEQILKTRQGLLRNSDDIIKTLKFIQEKTQQLQTQKNLSQNKKNTESLHHLLNTSQILSHSVNQFLTNNAIINNSIRALPILIKKLNSDHFVGTHLTEQLLNAVYHYILWPQAESKQKIMLSLAELDPKQSNENLQFTETLEFIKAHCSIILLKTPLIIENLHTILNVKFDTTLLQLESNTIQSFNHNHKQKQYLEWIIYAIAISLTLFVFSFISSLRKSQQKLAEETLFLNTLLNTISDGVIACNSEGDITLYNRAISQMHGCD